MYSCAKQGDIIDSEDLDGIQGRFRVLHNIAQERFSPIASGEQRPSILHVSRSDDLLPANDVCYTIIVESSHKSYNDERGTYRDPYSDFFSQHPMFRTKPFDSTLPGVGYSRGLHAFDVS